MYRMKSFSFCGKIMSPKIPIFLGTVTIRSRSKNMRDEAECKAEFRVEKKNDLHRLAEALQIPGTSKCYRGTVFLVWY